MALTKSTRPFKEPLTEHMYHSLKKRGVILECSYQHCEDKQLKPGQRIVAVTRGSGYGSVTKRYHEKCRKLMYSQLPTI